MFHSVLTTTWDSRVRQRQELSPHSNNVLGSSCVSVGSLRLLWFPPTMPEHTSRPPGFSQLPVGVIASAETLTTAQAAIENT